MPRLAEHPIEPYFTARWSPRAMNGEPLPLPTLLRLFEAARWAPSSGNNQSWRFLYALGGSPEFPQLFGLLNEGNQSWCARAGALVVVLSKKTRAEGKPVRTHAFDAGASWMSLALQGSALGLVTHGMEGFDYDRARSELGVPDDFDPQCMIAIGFPGRVEDLPERLRAREVPSDRRPVAESAAAGRFPEGWKVPRP